MGGYECVRFTEDIIRRPTFPLEILLISISIYLRQTTGTFIHFQFDRNMAIGCHSAYFASKLHAIYKHFGLKCLHYASSLNASRRRFPW